MWNKQFNKGISIFQLCMGISMLFMVSQPKWVLFFCGVFLMAYFEPADRFSIDFKFREQSSGETKC